MSEQGNFTQFSLFEGDLPNRIFTWLYLPGRGVLSLMARTMVLILFTWCPLAVLSLIAGVAFGRPPRECFFYDIAAYGQFLLGLPIFVIAERTIGEKTSHAAKHFLQSGLIPADKIPGIEAIHERIAVYRKLLLPDLIALALGYLFTYLWISQELTNEFQTWHALGPPFHQRLTAPGWWEVLVCVPLLNYWWLRWVYKIGLWCWYLYHVSRVRLKLIASHPDFTGGLEFLSQAQTGFGIAIFAFGCGIVTASVGYKLAIEKAPIEVFAVWGPLVGFALFAPIFFTAPLFMFTKQLHRLKQNALEQYEKQSTLAASYFEEKWLNACPEGTCDYLLGSHLSGMANLNKAFDTIKHMRVVPLDSRSFFELVGSAVGPMLFLLPYVVDVPEPVMKVLEMLGKSIGGH